MLTSIKKTLSKKSFTNVIRTGLIIYLASSYLNAPAHDKNERFESHAIQTLNSFSRDDSSQLVQFQRFNNLKTEDSDQVFKPKQPVTRILSNPNNDTNPGGTLRNPTGTSQSSSCMVDFDDFDALNLLGYAPEGFLPYAKDTFAWSPWWHQACTALKYAVVRPINEIHFHLAFEDPDIKPCPGGPSFTEHYIVHDDDTCEDFDPREKARSLMPHDVNRLVKVYVHEGNGPIPFGLNSIRVRSNVEIDLCYKPTGPWEAAEPGDGPWICWEGLYNGVWDFSGLITETTQIRINAHEFEGIFKVDDIDLNIF